MTANFHTHLIPGKLSVTAVNRPAAWMPGTAMGIAGCALAERCLVA